MGERGCYFLYYYCVNIHIFVRIMTISDDTKEFRCLSDCVFGYAKTNGIIIRVMMFDDYKFIVIFAFFIPFLKATEMSKHTGIMGTFNARAAGTKTSTSLPK